MTPRPRQLASQLREEQASATLYRRLAERSRGSERRKFLSTARMFHAMTRARLDAPTTGNLSFTFDPLTEQLTWRTL